MRRKRAAKAPSGSGRGASHRDGQRHAGPSCQEQKDPYKVPFFLILGLCALLGAYMLIPSKYTGPTRQQQASEGRVEADPPSSRERDTRQDSFEEIATSGLLDSGVSCEELISLAKEVVDTKPKAEWDPALDLLATCALQEPHNSAPLWNLAVILLQMDQTEEALEFIDQALTLDPSNLEYLKTSGGFLSKLGHHAKAMHCLESYLEVSLRVPSWEQLLASISIQREDEWMFLYDAGEDVISVLEMLQTSYLHERSWIKAGYLYRVIIGLKGEERVEMELLASYSIFAFGLGDFATGVKYLRLYTERQYMKQGYGDSLQAYEVVTAHSLRLLTAGFDAQMLSIGKNLLMAGDSVWEELVYNCELSPEDDAFNFTTYVTLADLRRTFLKCLRVQNVVGALLDEGGVVYADNQFGWSPLLHAAAVGSVGIVRALLAARSDPQARTVLAHTSLHVAAMRGSYDVAKPLIQAGLNASEVDYFNRTALHVACLHRWSAKGMAKALNQQLPQGCPIPPLYHPPPKLSTRGGWSSSDAALSLPPELTSERCDFDVLGTSDVQAFTFDYLALQRPVLIRNATSIHSMKRLHQLWHRSKFKQEYGTLTFDEVEVPYAEAFGYNSTRKTTVKDFMNKMREFQENNQHLPILAVRPPSYIFETVPLTSPLLREFSPPAVLDQEVTHISPLKLQFYMGPPLSGAPVHFHRNAWNLLVYGQKRWFLYPPDRAFYSKQHVWDWWRESYTGSPDALECVQYPGDLVFVPDMWGHAVINLREGVGVASEFVYGASEFSI